MECKHVWHLVGVHDIGKGEGAGMEMVKVAVFVCSECGAYKTLEVKEMPEQEQVQEKKEEKEEKEEVKEKAPGEKGKAEEEEKAETSS